MITSACCLNYPIVNVMDRVSTVVCMPNWAELNVNIVIPPSHN